MAGVCIHLIDILEGTHFSLHLRFLLQRIFNTTSPPPPPNKERLWNHESHALQKRGRRASGTLQAAMRGRKGSPHRFKDRGLPVQIPVSALQRSDGPGRGHGEFQPGLPARSRVRRGHESPQGRCCDADLERGAADPSVEPGERPQPGASPRPRRAPAAAPPAARGSGTRRQDRTARAASPPVTRSFPARTGFTQNWGRGKRAGALGEASGDTDPSSCPDRGGGEPAIALGVPRARAGVSPAAGREAGPARRRS